MDKIAAKAMVNYRLDGFPLEQSLTKIAGQGTRYGDCLLPVLSNPFI
jgi:hypothetical protein